MVQVALVGRSITMPAKIKKEGQPKPNPPCINGLTAAALSMRVKRKLEKLKDHKWLREFYEGKIKCQRMSTTAEKETFLRNLLDVTDINDSTYFKRLKENIHEKAEGSRGLWVAWKLLQDKDKDHVLELALAQGKIEKRPKILLDHSDPRTQELDEVDRMEYRWVENYDDEKTRERRSIQQADDDIPIDKVAED